MPFGSETVDLDDAAGQARDDRDTIVEAIEDVDEDAVGDDVMAALDQQLQEAETRLQGVRWARDRAADDDRAPAWDADVDAVTLQGLTGGEYAELEDELAGSGGTGSARVFLVAHGTAAAPYVDEEQTDDQRLAAAASLPIQYLKWAEYRINQIMSLDDDSGGIVDVGSEGNGSATSSGSPTPTPDPTTSE